jgi:hypothetical protein
LHQTRQTRFQYLRSLGIMRSIKYDEPPAEAKKRRRGKKAARRK